MLSLSAFGYSTLRRIADDAGILVNQRFVEYDVIQIKRQQEDTLSGGTFGDNDMVPARGFDDAE